MLTSQCKRLVSWWQTAKGGVSDVTRHATPLSRTSSTVAVIAANDQTPVSAQGLAEFEERVASQMPELLDRLLHAPAHPRAEHPEGSVPRASGVYLFWADGKPIYVGQTRKLRDRLRQHCIPSSTDLSASFAWNLAKREASRDGIDTCRRRAALMADAAFRAYFVEAKATVALMPVQFTVEEHADLRTVFEVYATYALGTQEFNSFETH
jgi:hypothetical protein